MLLALIFYLKYKAPEDEQNFPMVMEMLRYGEVHEDDDEYESLLDKLFAQNFDDTPHKDPSFSVFCGQSAIKNVIVICK